MWSFFSRDSSRDLSYELGKTVTNFDNESVWTLLEGKKKLTGEQVSIFKLEINLSESNKQHLEVAKSSIKRLKTLRHPSFITYIDSFENDKIVLIVTEYVVPLSLHLKSIENYNKDQKIFDKSYGIYQISTGLNFLINDCNLLHNNININSIFVNATGVWKIGNLEYVTNNNTNFWPKKLFNSLKRYDPPEHGKNINFSNWSRDAYGFGCLIYEIFHDKLNVSTDLLNAPNIPKNLKNEYDLLISKNASTRLNFNEFITKCRTSSKFLNNKFLDTMIFLDEIQLKDINEKNKFFSTLNCKISVFPPDLCKKKILPQLVQSIEFSTAAASILEPLFETAKLLDSDEYQKQIIPCIIKLFSFKDRVTRAKLLQKMDLYIDYLQPKIINDQLFLNIAQGFLDSNPAIREQTVKCMLLLAPKLNHANLNEELLKHFSRIQIRDEEASIRINTIVCLSKIACYLQPKIRQNILVVAFLRSLRDPVSNSRLAAIKALSTTQTFYSLQDTATKVMPALCHMTIDQEKNVRDEAFKVLKQLLKKVEKISIDPSAAEELESQLNVAGSNVNTSKSNWALWAVSSFTSKLGKISKTSTESNLSAINNNIKNNLKEISNDDLEKKNKLTKFTDNKYGSDIEDEIKEEKCLDNFEENNLYLSSQFNKTENKNDENNLIKSNKNENDWDNDDLNDLDFDDLELKDDNKSIKKIKNISTAKKLNLHKYDFDSEIKNDPLDEIEYSFSSKKKVTINQENDLWNSLGNNSNNLKKTQQQQLDDDLFSSLADQTKFKSQRKRGAMKLGAHKLN